MAFNPLSSILQGQQAGQAAQVQRLAGDLTGQMQGGQDAFKTQTFQQLMALDPDRANKMVGTFGALKKERRMAAYDDAITLKGFLDRGDTAGAGNFVDDRIDALGGIDDADASGSMMWKGLLDEGRIEELHTNLTFGLEKAAQLGELKSLPKAKKEALQYKEGGIIFNPNSGEVQINEKAANRLTEIAQKKEAGETITLKDKQSINKDITGFLKDVTLIHNTANDLSKLQKMPSGPASIALVFKFMKALDPTSVVREGEFSTAQNSAGVPEGVRNMYNKLASGEILGDKQIQQFVDTAQGLSNSAVESSSGQITNYLDTYGDSLPASFSTKIMGRIPKAFDIKSIESTVMRFDAQGNPI